MATRFAEHLLTGDHASLPAANAVPQGTLYSCTDHQKIYQSDGASTWSDWAAITGATPGAHAASHQDGGADEIDVTDLSGLLADAQTPLAHATSHEDGGADEIDVTGLSGLLADAQTPASHTHPQSEITDLETDLGAIDTRVDALENVVAPAAQGTWLASGGGVSLISGLQFLVSAGTGYINAQLVSWAQDSITLDAADGSNDRFDAIIIDSAGNVDKVTGTPSASPELPTVDVLTQLVLTYVLVGTGVTDIPITKTAIYQENTEWTSAQSGGTIDPDSVSEPHAGTKCVEATAAANGHYAEFSDSAMSLANQKQLVFQIKNKASWPNQKSIAITWYNGTAKIGQSVQLANGKYGFVHANTTTYQQIIIPITDFGIPGGAQVTKIRFAVAGGGAAIGWRIDEIYLDASSTVVIVQPVAVASASVSGTVKTDVTVGDPLVYIKDSVDLLLAAKAPLASPALTGVPTAPTAAAATNTTQLATTAFVQQEIAGAGGVSVLDDLTDVNAAAPNDGDVLIFDSGSGDWVAAAPASDSVDLTPDKPPASPNAADDEFDQADGTAVDTAGTRFSGATAWTEYNKGSATIEQRRGALIITVPADADLMDPRGVTQPLPAGDSVFEARVMFSPNGTTGWANYQGAGLGFKESATSKMLLLTIGLDAASVVYQVRKMTAAQTWLNNQYSSGTNVHQFLWSYFRIARSGTNLLFSISLDLGHSFFQVHSVAQTTDFTTAPDQVMLFANARSAAASTGTFPWFRRIS